MFKVISAVAVLFLCAEVVLAQEEGSSTTSTLSPPGIKSVTSRSRPHAKSAWELEKDGFDAYNKKDMAKAAELFSEALTPRHGKPNREVAKAKALLNAGKEKKAAKLFRKIVLNNIHRESEAYTPEVSGGYAMVNPYYVRQQAVLGLPVAVSSPDGSYTMANPYYVKQQAELGLPVAIPSTAGYRDLAY